MGNGLHPTCLAPTPAAPAAASVVLPRMSSAPLIEAVGRFVDELSDELGVLSGKSAATYRDDVVVEASNIVAGVIAADGRLTADEAEVYLDAVGQRLRPATADLVGRAARPRGCSTGARRGCARPSVLFDLLVRADARDGDGAQPPLLRRGARAGPHGGGDRPRAVAQRDRGDRHVPHGDARPSRCRRRAPPRSAAGHLDSCAGAGCAGSAGLGRRCAGAARRAAIGAGAGRHRGRRAHDADGSGASGRGAAGRARRARRAGRRSRPRCAG